MTAIEQIEWLQWVAYSRTRRAAASQKRSTDGSERSVTISPVLTGAGKRTSPANNRDATRTKCLRGGTNMRSSLHSYISIATTFVLCLCLGACKQEQDKWPALLQNVTASGGYWGACPPKDRIGQETLKTMGRLGTSPELDARLNAGFPPGSDAQKLERILAEQGFHLDGVCQTDRSIHAADFFRKGEGFLSYGVSAEVYWKVDQIGKIEWTKGFVMFVGL